MAARLQPAADHLARAVGPGRGRLALDLAAGTGNTASALARAGWSVTATDVTPRMVELGRRRTGEDGLDVRWDVAELADQPLPDAGVDLVASTFGLVFALDPVPALAEVARVLRPGGVLALTAWRREGLCWEMTQAVTDALGAQDGDGSGGWDGSSWAAEDAVGPLLDAAGLDRLVLEPGALPWEFGSAHEGRRFLELGSPSHAAAATRLGPGAGAGMLDRIEELMAGRADAAGVVRTTLDYALVRAVRHGHGS